MDPELRWLLLTAGPAAAVRQQLGLSAADELALLATHQQGLSPETAGQLDRWAACFLDLCHAGGPVEPAGHDWAREGMEVATAMASELAAGVQLRYVADSIPTTVSAWQAVRDPIAGLFQDVHRLPVIPAQNGWTAYRSLLTLDFGRGAEAEAAPEEPWLSAIRTDVTDDELRELRRRAIDPVVASLLTPDEQASAQVIVYRYDDGPGINVWLQAAGEEMRHWIRHPDDGVPWSLDPVDVAERFADSMSDWVCETRFAWGQHRIASYQVPAD